MASARIVASAMTQPGLWTRPAVTAGRVHGGLSADIRVHEREASSILARAGEYWVAGRDGAGLRSGFMVDRDVLDVIEREIADEVRTRFTGDAVAYQRLRDLQRDTDALGRVLNLLY